MPGKRPATLPPLPPQRQLRHPSAVDNHDISPKFFISIASRVHILVAFCPPKSEKPPEPARRQHQIRPLNRMTAPPSSWRRTKP
jgi:hypothetical protein